MNKNVKLVLTLALGVLFAGPSRAELHDRGNGLIYDDVLKITWLQDAKFGGYKKWKEAVEWAANLEYQGFDDWRLPSISVSSGVPTGAAASPVDCATATELECRDNELGYMYFHNLGGKGNMLTGNQGLIQNMPDLRTLSRVRTPRDGGAEHAAGFQERDEPMDKRTRSRS